MIIQGKVFCYGYIAPFFIQYVYMKFESFVAKRYLLSQSKGVFSLITTIIGVLGVCVGVAALITTLAVMSGFQNDIKNKVIGAQAHIMVMPRY